MGHVCLLFVTEHHAFKVHPVAAWVRISPFVAREGPVVWSAPVLPSIRQHANTGRALVWGARAVPLY